ncbi:MAG: PepSY domain-containing protein [Sulfuricaulis sp.]
MKIRNPAITLTGVALLCTAMASAYAYDGAQYAKDAKQTMEQARAQALKLTPGTIKSAELEKETGGSGLRYSFDIQTRNGLREVGIDAVSGKVLENGAETREARSEHEPASKNGESGHEDENGKSDVHSKGER